MLENFDLAQLPRYPCQKEIGFNNGGEFVKEFSNLCNNMGLTQCPSSFLKPQSNAILRRIHQVLADYL